jgi:hypothetical protein
MNNGFALLGVLGSLVGWLPGRTMGDFAILLIGWFSGGIIFVTIEYLTPYYI